MLTLIVMTLVGLSVPQTNYRAEMLNTRAIRKVFAQLQSTQTDEATELSKKIVKLYSEGNFQEALPLAKRVVQLRETSPKPDVEAIRNAYNNLAEVYLALWKYADSEKSFRRVIDSYKKFSPNDVRLAEVLARLALVQVGLNNVPEAESAYKESLRLKESLLGTDDPVTMKSVWELAEFYQFTGDYEKAVPHYQRMLSFREKETGPKHREELAAVADRYVCVLRKLGKSEEANLIEARMLAVYDPLPAAGRKDQDVPQPDDAALTVLNGKAISLPRPVYPAEARSARASGTVQVRVTIDEKGNVIRACAIKGHRQLLRTSELAAYKAKFTPTTLSGHPVTVMGIITYNYVMR